MPIPGAEISTRYEIRQGVHMPDTQDGSMVLLHLERDEYLPADEIGAEILRAIARNGSMDELVGGIAEKFDVDEDVVRDDVRAFLESCARAGILESVRTVSEQP